MKTLKPATLKPRPVAVGCLAAQVLGRSRVSNNPFTAHDIALAFPGFQPIELDTALSELLDKNLLNKRGAYTHPTYFLTDRGRDSRIVVD